MAPESQQQPQQPIYSARVTSKHVSIIDPESVFQFQRQQLLLQGNAQAHQHLQGIVETRQQQQQQQEELRQQQEQQEQQELDCQHEHQQQQEVTDIARHNSYSESPDPTGADGFSTSLPEFDAWIERKGGGAKQLQSMGEYCMCLREA
jgi:hypothetical protein